MTRDFEPLRGVPGMDETSRSPAQVKERIRSLNPLDRDTMDRLLFGKPCTELDREMFGEDDFESLKARYPADKPWKGINETIWTPYDKIKKFVLALELAKGTTLYDLGAGYGRVPLYAGITTDATCKGIELVPERAERAQAAKERLELDNVEIINANVLDVDFSDGDIFYLYNPFSSDTFKQVLTRLQQIATQKPVTIVARANVPAYDSLRGFTLEGSLSSHPLGYGDRDMVIYKSNLYPPTEQSRR